MVDKVRFVGTVNDIVKMYINYDKMASLLADIGGSNMFCVGEDLMPNDVVNDAIGCLIDGMNIHQTDFYDVESIIDDYIGDCADKGAIGKTDKLYDTIMEIYTYDENED